MLIQLPTLLFIDIFPFFILKIITKFSKSRKSTPPSFFPKSYPIIGSLSAIKSHGEIGCHGLGKSSRVVPLELSPSTFYLVTVTSSRRTPLMSSTCSRVTSPTTRKALSLTAFSSIFSATESSTSTVSPGSFRDKFQATSSTPSLFTVIDLQELLQRLAFDNVRKIAFGFDPACLSPSLPSAVIAEFAEAFEDASNISSRSCNTLRNVRSIRNHDTATATDAATAILYYVSKDLEVEKETTSLNPLVPVDGKRAVDDDVLPDQTVVKKGAAVTYHPYVMERMEMIWGSDWAEFKQERWLPRDDQGKWSFMKRVMAGVLRQFKMVPAVEDGFQPSFIVFLTSKMKGGFPVRIKDRVDLD
ncbi:Cytochrome P450 [Hibiscus syriacus]|uniref:Cytochrome P450 n=1 Tax=Hibiscus syriacus TaxID=106335 RepID=A0A6A2YAG2_HIBSY|nr:Cytochrome P450 [Hibiscus syriacus]